MTTTDLRPTLPTEAGARNAPTSPLLDAEHGFEAHGRPCRLRMDIPLAAGEMVAALYGEHKRLHQIDLEDDEHVWMYVALVLVQDGLDQIEQLANGLIEEEQAGTLAAPDWLALCRRRVATVIGKGWDAAKHRCPCGYATDDPTAFDAHLDEANELQPEHFEVLDEWTLEQVLGWREPRTVDGHEAAAAGDALPEQPSPAGDAAVPAKAHLRRRVIDVPEENVVWFREHGGVADGFLATELARAELTAQRDGYVIRWAHPWVCQIREPHDEGDAIKSAFDVTLDGTPETDPLACQIEERLLHEAGLRREDAAEEPASVEHGDDGRLWRRYASYHIFWEQVWVCRLFEPDGVTLIAGSDGLTVDPDTDPRARVFVAYLALDAGI